MTDHDIASWLRHQLARREWSGADLARRLDVSTGRVSEWTSGKRRPNPRTCIHLADVLGMDPDQVLAIAGHRVHPEPLDDPKADLIALIRQADLSPDVISGISAMVRDFTKKPNPISDPEA